MRHYKDSNGKVRGIDASQDHLVKPDWVEIAPENLKSVLNQLKTADQIAEEENSFVLSELISSDVEINKHDDGDARAIATKAEWQAYRCQLRDYIKDGQIVGGRPKRPI